MKPKRGILAFIGSCALVSVSACTGLTHTHVNDLLHNPRNYEGKSVTISGTVTKRNSLLVKNFFMVKDETGEIPVFTDRALPQIGTKVRIHGHVSQVIASGSDDVVVFNEDPIEEPK